MRAAQTLPMVRPRERVVVRLSALRAADPSATASATSSGGHEMATGMAAGMAAGMAPAIGAVASAPTAPVLPPIGMGECSPRGWPTHLPRSGDQISTTASTATTGSGWPHIRYPMRCPRDRRLLHARIEREDTPGAHGVRVTISCPECDRAVASEERVYFHPAQWDAPAVQHPYTVYRDTLVREHALTLFHLFAADGWRTFDQLYGEQQGTANTANAPRAAAS